MRRSRTRMPAAVTVGTIVRGLMTVTCRLHCGGEVARRDGTVFDPRQREMLTFALLVSLGGCEPQVKSHIRGNVSVGNDKQTLLAVVTQLLPYIGYPRTLNAIACLNEAIPENE